MLPVKDNDTLPGPQQDFIRQHPCSRSSKKCNDLWDVYPFVKRLELSKCPEIINRENRRPDGLTHRDLTASHKTVKPRQSVTREVRPHRTYFLTAYLCFFTKHNCLNRGFTSDSKDDILYKRTFALLMLGYLFVADLEVDIPLEKSKNLYFCEALTAGIRGKGRKRAGPDDCCAPVTVRKKACFFLRKMTSDILRKEKWEYRQF